VAIALSWNNWANCKFLTIKVKPIPEIPCIWQLLIFYYLFEFLLSQAQQHILRLEICVYYPANPVQKIKPHKHLPCYLLHNVYGQTFAIIFLQHLPQINAEYLKHHAEVITVRPLVEEGIQ